MTAAQRSDENAGIPQEPSAASIAHAGTVRIPRRAHAAREQWRELAVADQRPALRVFDPDALHDQPEALQRWLRQAVAPGLPIGGAVHLSMHGQLRLRGVRRDFKADQLITPGHGYDWAATTTVGRLPCSGFDNYIDGVGQMRWKLLGIIPVVTAAGADVSRPAAGRLAVECVVAPTGFGVASWTDTPNPRRRARQVHIHPRKRRCQRANRRRREGGQCVHAPLVCPRRPSPAAAVWSGRDRAHHLRRPDHPQRATRRLGLRHRHLGHLRVLPSEDHRCPAGPLTDPGVALLAEPPAAGRMSVGERQLNSPGCDHDVLLAFAAWRLRRADA